MSGGEERDLVRDAQGVRRVVRVHDDREASVLHEALKESQDDELVTEIEAGFRLVEHEDARVGDERSGDEDHLELAARHGRAGHLGQVGGTHLVEDVAGHALLARSGLGEGAHVGCSPNHHHLEAGECHVGGVAGLRHVGQDAAQRPGRHRRNGSAVDECAPAVPLLQADHRAQQRRLAGAVGTQDRQE